MEHMNRRTRKPPAHRRARAIAKPPYRETPMRLALYAAVLAASLTYLIY